MLLKQDLGQEVRDIYKLDKQLSRIWKQINSTLSQESIHMIEKYDAEMINCGIAKATRIKQLKTVQSLSRRINKEWVDVNKNDIDRLVKDLMNEYGDVNGDETESSRDFKKILKLFFRWFKLGSRDFKEVGDPEETQKIRLRKPKDKITRENLLKEEDLTKLLYACGENLRDRAFIDVHFEAGTRPGEILSLQLKHVDFDNVGARINVDGKTGARPIRLIRSSPNLAAWCNAHPSRDDPESPLWILLDKKNYGKPMTYVAAKAMVDRRCKLAEIPKRVNLKLFRHTAATAMSKILTDAEMKKRHGWTRSSNMPSRYVHLIDSDVEEKILAHYGIDKKSKSNESKNLPKICPICELPNSPESKLCSKCGKPLDLKTAVGIDEQKDERIGQLESQMAKVLNKLEIMTNTEKEQ